MAIVQCVDQKNRKCHIMLGVGILQARPNAYCIDDGALMGDGVDTLSGVDIYVKQSNVVLL